MGLKNKLEFYYEKLFDAFRAYSAKRTRIKQFKNKASKKALSLQEIKQMKKFYMPYASFSPVFHRYYTEKTGTFCAHYIPQDIYVGYIDPYLNDLHAAKYLDNKCYYDMLFHNIPQPRLILKRINNIWLDATGRVLDQVEIKKILESQAEGMFIKEAQISAGGHGVVFVPCDSSAYEKVLEFSNKNKTDIVIQGPIAQHRDMARLNSSSVNSLRIYSVLKRDGTTKIYSAVVRIGVGCSKVDNYASGGVACGITENGTLRKYAYNKKGERLETHPTSHVAFENYTIPNYDSAVNLVKSVHPTIPHFRSVSWDIAISEDGTPLLIEANLCRGGIDLLQLCNGPLYGEDTENILNEVFNKHPN